MHTQTRTHTFKQTVPIYVVWAVTFWQKVVSPLESNTKPPVLLVLFFICACHFESDHTGLTSAPMPIHMGNNPLVRRIYGHMDICSCPRPCEDFSWTSQCQRLYLSATLKKTYKNKKWTTKRKAGVTRSLESKNGRIDEFLYNLLNTGSIHSSLVPLHEQG